MNDKILIADIIAAVADATAISKNRCDDFVKAFLDAIAKALAIDGVAKVKGLGTFKLVAVEERKSVNVQTGAEMMIPAHAKVSFLPDKVLKDEINKPYAHLKTYVLNSSAPLDPPEADDEDDSEIDDMSNGENPSAAETSPTADTVVTDVTVSSNGVDVVSDNNASVVGESLSTDKQTDNEINTVDESSNEKKDSHADWFDNWEVEYDSNESSDNQHDASKTNAGEDVYVRSAVADVTSVASTVTSNINEVSATYTTPESNSSAQERVSTDGNNDSDDNLEQEIKVDIEAPRTETEKPEESSDGVDNPEDHSSDERLEENKGVDTMDGGVKSAITGETDAPNPTDATITNATDGQNGKQLADNDKGRQQKVHGGKVLGVAIITFIVLLVLAYFGLKKIDPDFFKSLKISENPPVMPSDSTSLAEELSVYENAGVKSTGAVDSTVVATSSDSLNTKVKETPADVEAKDDVSVPTTPLPEKKVEKDVVDPLWFGDFVSYMKKKHPDVKLSSSGLKNEVPIKPGLFLTKVALDNYGDKSYWVYLYLYNKDRIKNPNNVPVGTKIRVPKLDASLVNGTNEECLNVAKEVRQVFVK